LRRCAREYIVVCISTVRRSSFKTVYYGQSYFDHHCTK